MDADFISRSLDCLLDQVRPYHDLVNTCMVSFIVEDYFETILPQDIQKELMRMSDQELSELPSKLMTGFVDNLEGPAFPAVHQILNKLNVLLLDNCGIAVSVSDVVQSETEDVKLLEYFDKFMPEKKTHEVRAMASFVRSLANDWAVDSLLDIGSGKGYLSQVLAAFYDIPVLAVDSQAINRVGAEKREVNLSKRWDGLQRRAGDRAAGNAPSTKKQKKQLKAKEAGDREAGHAHSTNNQLDKIDVKPEESERQLRRQVVHLTKFVTEDSDLATILSENLHLSSAPPNEQSHGIIGLHTCGNLAAASMKIFVSCDCSRFICNVPCCYHHLDEHFFVNPFVDWDTEPQFPMSSKLMEMQFWLGRNARMLAAQPLDRLATNFSLPTKSLLWRSILQVMFQKYAPDLSFKDQQVGRIASKSADFIDYVRKAFKKTAVESQLKDVSDEDILQMYSHYSALYEKKLNAFYQFRLMFAPLVESIILVDRLLYLLENPAIKNAHLVKLFDSNISPRSYAIVAVKKR